LRFCEIGDLCDSFGNFKTRLDGDPKKNIRAAEYFAAKVANSINNTWQSKRDVNFTRKYGAVKYTKRYGMSETGCSKLFLCLWFQSFLAFFIFTFG
jgi:hypothetical protein